MPKRSHRTNRAAQLRIIALMLSRFLLNGVVSSFFCTFVRIPPAPPTSFFCMPFVLKVAISFSERCNRSPRRKKMQAVPDGNPANPVEPADERNPPVTWITSAHSV
jgi:hypothetical protein